jgi:Fe-S cluster assembly ATPase SufC
MGNSKYNIKSGDILLDNKSIKNLSPNERANL